MSSNSRSVNELKTELAAVEGKVKDANAQLAAAMQGLKAAEEKRQEALDKKDQFAIDQALLSINVANKAINTALHLVEKWGERLGKLLDDLSQAEKAAFEDKRKESKKVGGEQKSTTAGDDSEAEEASGGHKRKAPDQGGKVPKRVKHGDPGVAWSAFLDALPSVKRRLLTPSSGGSAASEVDQTAETGTGDAAAAGAGAGVGAGAGAGAGGASDSDWDKVALSEGEIKAASPSPAKVSGDSDSGSSAAPMDTSSEGGSGCGDENATPAADPFPSQSDSGPAAARAPLAVGSPSSAGDSKESKSDASKESKCAEAGSAQSKGADDFQPELLQLPASILWMGDTDIGSQLFVRPSYQLLYDRLLRFREQTMPRLSGCCIRGSPGIGKSSFLAYLLWRVSSEPDKWGSTIVVDSPKNQLFMRLQRQEAGSWAATPGSRGTGMFADDLQMPTTLYLFDAFDKHATTLPLLVNAFTIAACSPSSSAQKLIGRPGMQSLFMPLWTMPELELARTSCFSSVSPKLLAMLVAKWGLVIRWTLAKAHDNNNSDEFEDAVRSVSLESAIAVCGSSGGMDAAGLVHRVVLMDVTDSKLEKWVARFASKTVLERVLERMGEEREARTKKFLIDSCKQKEQAGLRGQLFEPYCHRLLMRGGAFKARDLATGKADTVLLPRMEQRPIRTIADIGPLPKLNVEAKDGNVYGIPAIPNFPVLDSCAKPYMLQMTVALDHGMLAKQAVEIMAQGVGTMLWVVPDDVFPSFGRQKLYSPDGKKPIGLNDKDGIPPLYSKLRQLRHLVVEVCLTAVSVSN